MGVFNSKNFNGEVFAAYVEKEPNLNRNELLKSKALVARQDLAAKFSEQVGGNYATVPIVAKLTGAANNYDGNTDITAEKLGTYTQGRIVVGRADSWEELDFTQELTGKDFMEEIASQVAQYWDEVDQATLLSTLKGIFSMTGAENLKFVNGHTYDISAKADGTGVFGPTTLNNAMQQALGDNKAKFTLAIMHSAVATNLENLKLLEYMKYTDANGIERQLGIATLNGRTVLIDDTMPTENATDYVKYTTYVLGDGAIEYTNCGAKVPYETNRDPITRGGVEKLIGRQRKIFAPKGISFTNTSIISPTDAQLETGANWSLANSNETSKKYFPHKAIPIARVITRG